MKWTNLVPSSVCFSECCRFSCFDVLRHLFTCDPIYRCGSCTDIWPGYQIKLTAILAHTAQEWKNSKGYQSEHILSFSLHPSLYSVVATSHSHVSRVQVAADVDSLKAIKCKYQSWLVNCNLSTSITLARVNNPYKWFWEPTWNPKKGQVLNPWTPWDYFHCLHVPYTRIAKIDAMWMFLLQHTISSSFFFITNTWDSTQVSWVEHPATESSLCPADSHDSYFWCYTS